MTDNNTIAINYSDGRLRVLVEEFVTQQRGKFTLKGVCTYVLYWAMEDGCTAGDGLFESNQLAQGDCDRVSNVLAKIVREGRLAESGNEVYCKL